MDASTTERADLVARLQEIARELRITDIEMLAEAGSGHPGGTLSAADMVAALFFHTLRLRPDQPGWPDRDRFVLSKGHCIPIVYAAMAKLGFFEEKELMTLRDLGSRLQGHPDRRMLPGIEASTGSLGQGLSIAAGMAVAAKLGGASWRTFCMVGDGEIQAGQMWEAIMFSARHSLDNLTAILDYNQVQQTGKVAETMTIDPIVAKLRAFGWHVREIDGHDMEEILDALEEADLVTGRPAFIVAHTKKGKGVSWMELQFAWHGKAPGPEEAERALAELRGDPGGEA